MQPIRNKLMALAAMTLLVVVGSQPTSSSPATGAPLKHRQPHSLTGQRFNHGLRDNSYNAKWDLERGDQFAYNVDFSE
jgi:hypothetical protein